MALSNDYRIRLAKEFAFSHEKMSESPSPLAKLYWFTASFNMAQRIMNLEYDNELLFLFTVCQTAHGQLAGRLASLSRGADIGAGLPVDIFSKLEDIVLEMGKAISNSEDLTPLLKRIATIGYSATGNGYFLSERGDLTLFMNQSFA